MQKSERCIVMRTDELDEDCICWDGDNDTDEFNDENVVDTFRQMNAFDHARWLKAKGKI